MTSPINPEQLQHLQSMVDAATPGELECISTTYDGAVLLVFKDGKQVVSDEDERLFAAMRNAFPDLLAEVVRLTKQRDIFLKALHGVSADLEKYGQIDMESVTTSNIVLSYYLAADLQGEPMPPHIRFEVEQSEFWTPKEPQP
jgi:hypothetical protein